MTVLDTLVGHSIPFYGRLGRYVGGAKAALFLSCIAACQDECRGAPGVSKTAAEIEHATGLTSDEQRTARKSLRAAGVLIEAERRLEHKVFYRIDVAALLALIDHAREEQS